MRRMLRSRKGVSAVVAAVLMIVITIIGMSILFAFFVNYARDFQLGRGSAVLESLVIEMVYWDEEGWDGVSPATVDIWVYNVGKVEVNIANVYVNDNLAKITHVDNNEVIGQTVVEVSVGEDVKISVTSNSLESSANRYTLATLRGSTVEGRY